MWNIMTKRRHEIKAIDFILEIQRKKTNSRSQDWTSRVSRKQLK